MKFTDGQTAQLLRSLGSLLHAGLSLADGLHLMAQEETGEKNQLLLDMGRRLDAGASLGDAMEEIGGFPETAAGMIRTGQATGRLEDALSYLADFYDQREQTAREMKNALGYPALIFALMLTVIAVLLMEVLPVFETVYASLGSGMTGIASGLLRLGGILKQGLPVLFALLLLGTAGFLAYSLVPAFRERIKAWFLQHWGDKSFARKLHNAQFAQVMTMGMGSGLGMEESLALAKNLLAHVPDAKARVEACEVSLSQGTELAPAMVQSGLLSPAMARMLAVSLHSGSGEETMAYIADRLYREAREDLQDLVSRVEPALVLGCSVLVGAILLAVMLPLVNILSVIG